MRTSRKKASQKDRSENENQQKENKPEGQETCRTTACFL